MSRRTPVLLDGSVAPSGNDSREFHFSQHDFEQVRQLIYQRAGISLNPAKHDMVYSRLARRLRARGLKRFCDYLALLRDGDDGEWEAFTNALTTNLTSFFREAHHFSTLAEQLRHSRKKQQIRLWCCAASTGEEAYSMAMTAVEVFDSFNPPVSILATDLDTQVLAKAQAGVYAAERVERMEPGRVRRFFLRGAGLQSGQVRVRPELLRLITFRQVNLLDRAWPLQGPLDAIFCRNVMIYFDKVTQAGILQRFAPLLAPDGLLFVGHSESLFHVSDIFQLRGKTVYQLAGSHGNPSSRPHGSRGQ